MSDDSHDADARLGFPGAVRVAGLLLVALGGLQVLVAVTASSCGSGRALVLWGVGITGVLLAIAGCRVALGLAPDVAGAAAWSISMAVLLLGVAGYGLYFLQGMGRPDPNGENLANRVVRRIVTDMVLYLGPAGFAYLVPAALAVAGRRDYLARRAAHSSTGPHLRLPPSDSCRSPHLRLPPSDSCRSPHLRLPPSGPGHSGPTP